MSERVTKPVLMKAAIPSLIEFKSRTPQEQAEAYRAGYKGLLFIREEADEKWAAKRESLLQRYQEIAGWTDAEVAQLRISA